MLFRRQPPVHSPVSIPAIAAGLRAIVTGAGRDRLQVEEALRSRYDANEVLLTDSGTSALRLAITGAVRPGGRVALPAFSCYDIATAAVGAERTVMLYDVDPATLGPEPESLRAVLETEVDALVIAPLYGIPVDVDAIGRICQDAGVLLIEDAAQGVGASVRGRPLGAWGSVSVLSFGRGKGMTAGGGGALLAHDDRGANVVRGAANTLGPNGRGLGGLVSLLAQWLLARPMLYAIPAGLPFLRLGETIYREPRRPRRISQAAWAVLYRTRDRVIAESATRKRNAQRLLKSVECAIAFRAIEVPQGAEPGYLRLPLFRSQSAAYDRHVAGRLGVMRGYPRALCDLPELDGVIHLSGDRDFGGARLLAQRLITLPTHSLLQERDAVALERWIDAEGNRDGLPSFPNWV